MIVKYNLSTSHESVNFEIPLLNKKIASTIVALVKNKTMCEYFQRFNPVLNNLQMKSYSKC